MNDIERRALLGAAGVGALAAMAAGRARGPLDPPAGPIASTVKPLSEVEPRTVINDVNTPGTATGRYRITRPGSYYLIDNIGGVNGKHAIEITSSDVTIDLNGFQLSGIPASGAFDAVFAAAGGLSHITVMNGSIRNWGRYGINMTANNVTHARVQGIRASHCAGGGIACGQSSVIADSSASNNGTGGMFVGFDGLIVNCVASDNAFGGISANATSTVVNCTANGNSSVGISGAGTVVACSAHDNGIDGISCGSHGPVSNCTANDNQTGIRVGVGATIMGCSAAGNSQDGFSVNDGGSIIDCTAQGNAVANFRNADGCLVRGCSAFSNVSFPSQNNFVATGGESRLENNTATGATGIGFDINSAGNFLIGNTARNNAIDYSVAAGNVCYVIAAATSGAFNGSSGGVSPGTTNPWANFSF